MDEQSAPDARDNEVPAEDQSHVAPGVNLADMRSLGGNGMANRVGLEPVRTEGGSSQLDAVTSEHWHHGHVHLHLPERPAVRKSKQRIDSLEIRVGKLTDALATTLGYIDLLKAEQQRILRLLGDDAALKVESVHAPTEEDTGGERRPA